jgi:hypothetical protein
MDINTLTRRSFLEASAGIFATVASATVAGAARAKGPLITSGAIYGRVGQSGISAGTAAAPSTGDVMLLDGTMLKANHGSGQPISPGKSVVLAADENGGWSVIYAQT